MGLDMYLFARGGVNADTGDKIEDDEIGYWRKFNALHHLFLEVGGAQLDSNCEEVPLTLENLEYVYGICKKVKDILDAAPKHDSDGKPIAVKDALDYEGENYFFSDEVCEQAIKLLDPQEGFFWGNTEIDDFYHYKVCSSLPILERAIELAKQGEEIYYYSWW